MADNTVLNPGVGGDTIRDVAKTATGAKTQVMLVDGGGGSVSSPESIWTMGGAVTAASMPVTLASDQTIPATQSGSWTVAISGTPTVAIFGPTSPWHWKPLNPIAAILEPPGDEAARQRARIEGNDAVAHRRTADVAVETVLATVREVLASGR